MYTPISYLYKIYMPCEQRRNLKFRCRNCLALCAFFFCRIFFFSFTMPTKTYPILSYYLKVKCILHILNIFSSDVDRHFGRHRHTIVRKHAPHITDAFARIKKLVRGFGGNGVQIFFERIKIAVFVILKHQKNLSLVIAVAIKLMMGHGYNFEHLHWTVYLESIRAHLMVSAQVSVFFRPAGNGFRLGANFLMQLGYDTADFFASKAEVVVAHGINDDFERVATALDRAVRKSFLAIFISAFIQLHHLMFCLSCAAADKLRAVAEGAGHFDVLFDADNRDLVSAESSGNFGTGTT